MSHYLKECPNCKEMIGIALNVCPYCNYVLEDVPSQPPDKLSSDVYNIPETDTGQSALAYRIAAVILFVTAAINAVSVLVSLILGDLSSINPMISLIVDIILGIQLLSFGEKARKWVIIRAIFGGILSITAFVDGDVLLGALTVLIECGYGAALILLLTGKSELWRLVLAAVIFVILVLCLYGGLVGLSVLGLLMG